MIVNARAASATSLDDRDEVEAGCIVVLWGGVRSAHGSPTRILSRPYCACRLTRLSPITGGGRRWRQPGTLPDADASFVNRRRARSPANPGRWLAGVSKPDLSAAEARRIALAAQGFADRAPRGTVDARHARRVLERLGVFQIDSVNVLVRSHYLPLFSRLGPYPVNLLDTLAYKRRELFEYWGHEASFLPMASQPLFRWRMARYAAGGGWTGMVTFAREHPEYIETVYQTVVERGPISASGLDNRGERGGPWWGWDDGKRALEWLYWVGRIVIANRRSFERIYDLPERALPAEVLAAPTPSEEDAQRELLRIAARALGVATASDLADYFRIGVTQASARLAELVAAGELRPVTVEGWSAPAFLDPAAAIPRKVQARALL